MDLQDISLLMHNLKIISMISEQDKLITGPSARFGLRTPTLTRALSRWWYGERRDVDMQNLRALFTNTISVVLIERSLASEHGPTNPARLTATDRLVEAVRGALDGLRVLQRTYFDDQETCAALELLRQEVADRLDAATSVGHGRSDARACRLLEESGRGTPGS